jgi:hypothetical protein
MKQIPNCLEILLLLKTLAEHGDGAKARAASIYDLGSATHKMMRLRFHSIPLNRAFSFFFLYKLQVLGSKKLSAYPREGHNKHSMFGILFQLYF